MLYDSLYGLKLVVVEDRVDRVVLPRCRARTKSVRKAYARVRRNNPVARVRVSRFEDLAGAECVMAGDTVHVSPRGAAKLRTMTAEQLPPIPDRAPAPAAVATTADVTAEKLLELMKQFPRRPRLDFFDVNFLLKSFEMPPAFPADVFEAPEGGPKFHYTRWAYQYPVPTNGALLACTV